MSQNETKPKESTFDLLNVDQAARLLNLKKSRIYYEVFHKRLPHLKIGRTLRFESSSLIKWATKKQKGDV